MFWTQSLKSRRMQPLSEELAHTASVLQWKSNGHAFPPRTFRSLTSAWIFLWFVWEQNKCASAHSFLEGTLVSIKTNNITFCTHTHTRVILSREKRVFGWLHTCHKAYTSCSVHHGHSNDPPYTCRQCWCKLNSSLSPPCLLKQGNKAQVRLFACPSIWASRCTILPFDNSPTSGIRNWVIFSCGLWLTVYCSFVKFACLLYSIEKWPLWMGFSSVHHQISNHKHLHKTTINLTKLTN